MMSTKNLQGQCQQCGGIFDFPAEAAGMAGECPHCGQQTECVLFVPPEEKSPIRTKAIVFTVVALVILIGGLIAAQFALKRAQRMVGQKEGGKPTAQTPAKPVDPFAADGFRVGPVILDKASGSSLVYAQGVIFNITNRQRFGVKVELDLFDANGAKVASTSDYERVMEPKAEWKFRALVVEPKASFAKITSVKETK